MFRISRRWPKGADRPLRAFAVGHLQVGVLVAGLCLIGLAWAGLGYHLANREAALREQAHHDVRNMSVAVEKHVERLLVGVDQVLRFMAEDFASDPHGFDFDAWMRRATSLDGVANQISMFDADGELTASRTPVPADMPRFNVRDRAYFQALAARADLGLYIDRTLKGRMTGRYVLQTARRLTRPDGSFAGVILISVDPDYLSGQFAALDVGPGGSIGVFGQDGYIRARHPQVAGMYERNVTTLGRGAGVFAHLREAPDGSYEVASAFDGRNRIFGYRTVGSLPLVVTVSKPMDEVLAPYSQDRDRLVPLGIGFTVLALAVMLALIRGLDIQRRQGLTLASANATLSVQKEMARAAEARSHEANRILRLAAQIAHVGHWRVELPDNRLTWSDEVFRICGLEGTSQPSLAAAIAAYHPDDRALVQRAVEEAVLRGQPFDCAARVVRPDGSIRDVVSRGLCEHAADGTVVALFGIFMDVTALRSAERARGASEALYRLLADNSSDMISRMDLTGRRLFLSPACRELLGYEPEELVGTNPQGMVHPDDAAGLGAVIADLTAGRREQAINVNRLRHRDGHWVWVEASLRLLRDGDGAPSGLIGSIRNVTDRKRAEQALQESEHRFRLLAENTSEMIVLGHDDGRRSYVSPASQRLLGFEPDELAAMRLRDYVHPDDLARLYETTRSLGTGVAEGVCVYRALNRDIGWIWVEGTFRRIPDAQGDAPSIVATFRDVTERERQAKLLEQAAAAAEAGARAKSEFLANMSHELRTPLTGILGVHDLLRSDPSLPDRQRHLIGLAQDSGRALLAIVNDVLDVSKIEAGQLTLEPLPFGLRDLLDSCRQLAAETLAGKPVILDLTLAQDVPDRLVGDATRLRQILLNLLTNAAKFTSQGRITLSAGYGAADRRLRVAVADTGIGIPADKLPHLFERFSQADASTSRRYGGTGLGLAICKRLVELMGGEIGVTSEPGRGSTFWFAVPLPCAGSGGAAAPAVSLLGAPAGRPCRLLVAEDNAVNQEILRSVLERKGHVLTLVGDGAAAVAARQEGGPFDMILMDVQMPGLDGLEATRAIRAWERAHDHRAMPIVALTANALPEEVARCRAAGMDAHVAKPIDWGALFSAIERLQVAPATHGDVRPNDAPVARDGNPTQPGREPDGGAAAGKDAMPKVAFDRAAYEDVARILSPGRMADVLGLLIQQMTESFAEPSRRATDRERLRFEAHALCSTAGMVGLTDLSALCTALEACTEARVAADGEATFQAVLVDLRAQATAAIRHMRALRDEGRRDANVVRLRNA